ncbi:unnamed protein product (mitochondrion) [Plasmodiophora brassicae]|uniref:Uncharacterized protein n=1 Tax=Plasmodiophora brassicae TaxID=37360 RepID=A0A0G4IQX0_PLABS|nr:hypothetical protein PBRA_000914 [Plasmodiophora brassicae]SPQ97872.1 unnamed protein product [Plasmodiophora brassicae]
MAEEAQKQLSAEDVQRMVNLLSEKTETAQERQRRRERNEWNELRNKFPVLKDELPGDVLRVIRTVIRDKIAVVDRLTSFEQQTQDLERQLKVESKARAKLQDLARELQQQNKTIREAADAGMKTQQEAHVRLRQSFETAMSDITAKIEVSSNEREQQRKSQAELEDKINAALAVEKEQRRLHDKHLRAKDAEIELLKELTSKLRLELEHRTSEANAAQANAQHYASSFKELEATMKRSMGGFEDLRKQVSTISRRNKTVVKENARLAKQLNEKTTELAVVKEKFEKFIRASYAENRPGESPSASVAAVRPEETGVSPAQDAK